jgi:hypothetical protein
MSTIESTVASSKTNLQSADDSVSGKRLRTRRPLTKLMLMVVRRSHLYFGLLLVPWAILYGVTAYLFNHPTHFSSTTQKSISSAAIPKDWPTRDWRASSLAEEVISQLNHRFEDENKPIELASSIEPKFDGRFVTASYDHNGRSFAVSISLDGLRGSIRSQPVRVEAPKPTPSFFEITPPGAGARSRGRGGPLATQAGDLPSRGESKNTQGTSNTKPLFIDETVFAQIKSSVLEFAESQGHAIEAEQLRITAIP